MNNTKIYFICAGLFLASATFNAFSHSCGCLEGERECSEDECNRQLDSHSQEDKIKPRDE